MDFSDQQQLSGMLDGIDKHDQDVLAFVENPNYNIEPEIEAEVEQYFSAEKGVASKLLYHDENSVEDFVSYLRSKIQGCQPHQASGRVVFDTQDLQSSQIMLEKKRKLSDVSVGDIQKERTQKIDSFLSTKNYLTLLNLPTTLTDVFEFFMCVCDEEPLLNRDSTFWLFIKYLQMSDLLLLRQVCKSSHQLVTIQVQMIAVRTGGVLGELRSAFWQAQAPSFDIEHDLKLKMGVGSVFANVYREMRQRLNKVSKNVLVQITNDLRQMYTDRGDNPQVCPEFQQIQTICECLAFIFPQIGYCPGICYLAQVIQSTAQDIDTSVSILSGMILQNQLLGMYCDDQQEYFVQSHILDRIIEVHIPKLAAHFKKMNLKFEFFAGEWLVTFFCGYFTQEMACTALDNFMLEGWPAMYRICIALLQRYEDDFLSCQDKYQLCEVIEQIKMSTQMHDGQSLFESAHNIVIDVPLVEYELKYFVNLVTEKVQNSNKSQWNALDHKFLPSLITRLVLPQKNAVQQEIQKRQLKIKKHDQVLQKMIPTLKKVKSQFEDAQTEYEMVRDKLNCLQDTVITLKKEQHTLKQKFKMKQIGIGLKQKQIKYNVQQMQAQGMARDQIIEKVQILQLQKKEDFDQETEIKKIETIENDVSQMQKRVNQQESRIKVYFDPYQSLKVKYEAEQLKYDEENAMKQKQVDGMTILVQQLEADRTRHITQVAEAYQQYHIRDYRLNPITQKLLATGQTPKNFANNGGQGLCDSQYSSKNQNQPDQQVQERLESTGLIIQMKIHQIKVKQAFQRQDKERKFQFE